MVRRLKRHRGIVFWLVVISMTSWIVWRSVASRWQPAVIESLPSGLHRIERVVDGDTLLLPHDVRVRLIGLDAPELNAEDQVTVDLAQRAKHFVEDFVVGQEVRLRFDRERIDPYGRFLAYVYVDDRLLNEALIREGLARASLRFNYAERFKRIFRNAEAEAQTAARGIWSVQNGTR